jgi:hypothetical protein
MAAGIAGRIYHRLNEENYFASDVPSTEASPSTPPAASSASLNTAAPVR